MFKLYKQAFKTTNEGIILTIPLALFWWLITLYIEFSKSVVDTYPEMILSGVTMLFTTSAFCAGWFYMVKKCVKLTKKQFIFDKDKDNESIKLIKAMPNGIGRFFLHFVVVCLMFVGIALLMFFLIMSLGYDYVREVMNILTDAGVTSLNTADIQLFINQLQPEQTMELFRKIYPPVLKSAAVIISIPTIFSFLMLLWIPEIIFTFKNPAIALFTSIKKIFIHFFKSVKLYIYITIIQVLISTMGPFSLINPICYLLMIVVYFYFLVYVVVLIFSYYEQEFRKHKDEKAIINSDSGTDSER